MQELDHSAPALELVVLEAMTEYLTAQETPLCMQKKFILRCLWMVRLQPPTRSRPAVSRTNGGARTKP